MPKKAMEVPVSQRAIMQRVSRKLAQKNLLIRKVRLNQEGEENESMGRYYVVDVTRNKLIETHVELEELAQRVEVLAEWETMIFE